MPCAMSCAAARPPPSRTLPIRCISMSAGLEAGRLLLVSLQERRCDEPGRTRRHLAGAGKLRSIGCASASCPAPTTSTAISPPTGISPRKIPSSCSFSATTFTNTIEDEPPDRAAAQDGIVAATLPTYRNRYAQYRLDPDSAAAARAGAGARHLGRSRGGERLRRPMVAMVSTSRRSSCCSGRRPTRRSTSTCRCGRCCRIPTAGDAGL